MIESTGFGTENTGNSTTRCSGCTCSCTKPDCCSCFWGGGSYSTQIGNTTDVLVPGRDYSD